MSVPPRLRTELFACAVVVALGFVVAAPEIAADATSWTTSALVPVAALFGYVGWKLPENRPPMGGNVRTTIGLANGVTLLRGVLVCAVAGFAVTAPSQVWLPAGLYVTASVLDAVDGAIARRTRRTALGRRLDAAVDALGILLGSAAAVALGGVPAWYLLAGIVWYAYAGSLWFRRWRGRPVYELPPSRARGVIGAAQMVVVAAALVPLIPYDVVTIAAGVALGPLLVGFARDWAVATGRWHRHRPPSTDPEGDSRQ